MTKKSELRAHGVKQTHLAAFLGRSEPYVSVRVSGRKAFTARERRALRRLLWTRSLVGLGAA